MKEALIVVDMVKDFAPGGALPVQEVEEVTPYIKEQISKFRDLGIDIFFVNDWHEEDDKEFALWPAHCVRDTEGAEIITELFNEATLAYIVEKQTYDGFYETMLPILLKNLGIEKLTIVGCVAHICILFTVSSACLRGFEVVVPRAGVAGFDETLTESAFSIMENVLGVTVI